MIIRYNRYDAQYKIKILIILVPMMLVALLNYDNPDYITYITLYEIYYPKSIFYGSQELGFAFLNQIAISYGLSFQTFRNIVLMVSFFVFVIALYRFAKKECVSCASLLLAYGFMSYISNVIQLRQFLANSICFFALTFLDKKNKKRKVIFIALIFIASFIHISTIIYLLFLLVVNNLDRKFLRNISLTLATFTMAFGQFFYQYGQSLFGFLMTIGIRENMEESDALIRSLDFRIIIVFLIAAIISFLCERDYYTSEKQNDYISRINIFFPFFIALATLHTSGGRFLHVLNLIWIIDLSRRIKYFDTKYKQIYIISIVILVFLFGVSFWIPGTTNFNHSTLTIFKYNYLF